MKVIGNTMSDMNTHNTTPLDVKNMIDKSRGEAESDTEAAVESHSKEVRDAVSQQETGNGSISFTEDHIDNLSAEDNNDTESSDESGLVDKVQDIKDNVVDKLTDIKDTVMDKVEQYSQGDNTK